MKKFIALLISASIIAAPAAFAADDMAANSGATMQPMDQAAPAAAKPAAKKAHHQCHCKNCAHKHHKSAAKKPAPAAAQE